MSSVPSTPAKITAKIKQLEAAGDHDAMLRLHLQQSGKVVLGHLVFWIGIALSPPTRNGQRNTSTLLGQGVSPGIESKVEGTRFRSWSRLAGEWGERVPRRGGESCALAEAAASYGFFNTTPDPDALCGAVCSSFATRIKISFPHWPCRRCANTKRFPTGNRSLYL